jgi:WD40 repeat protein
MNNEHDEDVLNQVDALLDISPSPQSTQRAMKKVESRLLEDCDRSPVPVSKRAVMTRQRGHKSSLVACIGVAAIVLLIGALWISYPRSPATNHEVAHRPRTDSESAAPADKSLVIDERLKDESVIFENKIESRPEQLLVESESEALLEQLLTRDLDAGESSVLPVFDGNRAEFRVLNEQLSRSEYVLELRSNSKTEAESESVRPDAESVSIEPGASFARSNLASLQIKSPAEMEAEAKVVVVAAGMSFDLAPTAPGDWPEYLISWRVTRVLKGELAAKVISTRYPAHDIAGQSRSEQLRKWFIGTERILYLSELVPGKLRCTGSSYIKTRPDLKSLTAEEADKIRREFKIAERSAYHSDMLRVPKRWSDAHINATQFLLDRHRDQEDLKGFEWSYWDRRTQTVPLTIKGHGGRVAGVAFSSDGARLATASHDRTVKVWDPATGQEMLTLKGHTEMVWGLAFSPDGKLVASASRDKTAMLWDATTGEVKFTLEGHTGPVSSVAFSTDGKLLASASHDMTVKLWDTVTGEETLTTKIHPSGVTSVAFSPDGKRLASTYGFYPDVKVWDAATGEELLTLQGHTKQVHSVAFSPDGTRLASGSADKTVRVWDTVTGKQTLTLEGHFKDVRGVSFSRDGTRLASASWDGTLRVWDAATGQQIGAFKSPPTRKGAAYSHLSSVAFSPDGMRLAAGTNDSAVMMWQGPLTLKGHSDGVFSVAFSKDGKRLATASKDNTVKVWDAATGQQTRTLQGHTDFVWSVAFSPDGKRIVSAGGHPDRSEIKVWDVESGQEKLTLKGLEQFTFSAAFSPDGKRIAGAGVVKGKGSDDVSEFFVIKVWDANSGQQMLTLKGHNALVWSVAFSPDGKKIVSGAGGFDASMPGEVKVWDADSGEETLTIKGIKDVQCVAFSPDGKRIASAGGDLKERQPGELKVWDAASGRELLTLKGHASRAISVAFSPDDKRIVSGGGGIPGDIKLWDTESGRELLTLKGHTSGVNSVQFSPDGARLVSASGDKTVKVWDARPWTEELRVQAQARELLTVRRSRVESLEELQANIRTDQAISDEVRNLALDRAELFWKNRQPEQE